MISKICQKFKSCTFVKISPTSFYILFLFNLLFCKNNSVNNDNNLRFKPPIIINKSKESSLVRNDTVINFGYYYPLYIGLKKDTIYIPNSRSNVYNFLGDWRNGKKYRAPKDSNDIAIIIDTTKYVNYEDIHNQMVYKGYSMTIFNKSKDTLKMGEGEFLPINLEAINEKNEWRPIEEEIIYMDDNGYNLIFLPPKNLIITAVPIYTGKFKTILRLNYRGFRSINFEGWINTSQFPPTKAGARLQRVK